MKIYEEPRPDDEPIIISLEEFRRASPLPDDHPPQPTDDREPPETDETYWAGRNHAMRRSARWAA